MYNSVLTHRQRRINYSARVPLNAMKIAVMKVSDAQVVRFGPELLFMIYKFWFLVFLHELETQSS